MTPPSDDSPPLGAKRGARGAPVKPSIYDPTAVERMCEYLATGMGVKKMCRLPDVPSHTDLYVRLAKDEEFRATFARAREAQAAALVDEMMELADTATPANWQVVRLQIWARQWFAGKVAPRSYGDKIQHTNAAGDGNATVHVRVELVGEPAAPRLEQSSDMNSGRSQLAGNVRKSISLVG